MIYLISYVPNLLYNPADIHEFITIHLNQSDWWHYSGVYLLDTSLTSSQIASSLRGRYPNLQHFIVSVNLNDNNGLLPKEAWDWVNKKTGIRPKLKLAPKSPLSNILNVKQPKAESSSSLLELINKLNEERKLK
jgi:hypothetical protein